MSPHAQRRLFAIGALVIAAGAFAWLSQATMSQDLVYYWSPTELLAKGDAAKGATVRIMGLVEKGSVDWKPEEQTLVFRVTDGSKQVTIQGKGAPPQMFREGIGVVVEGELGPDGIFRSHEVLVKHNNEYKPPVAGAPAGDMSKTLATEGS